MLSRQLQNKVYDLWLEFHVGGITNPITVIEQISYLIFIRLLDMEETRNELVAKRTGKPQKHIFAANRQPLRWSKFRHLGGEPMLKLVRDEVFPFLKGEVFKQHAVGQYLQTASCYIEKATLMAKAVSEISDWPLNEGDIKGDLYEYLLGKLSTAGINGQFRTPRHIIAAMVELVDPKPTEKLGDPACGTAGFLISTMQYLRRKYSSKEGVHEVTHEDGSKETVYDGDKLTPYLDHIRRDMFWGFDFDSSMLRIAAMNMLLHGVDSPHIHYQDTLGTSFSEKQPQASKDFFDVILANPPFKGSLDDADTHESLRAVVKTKKTELLFIALMLRMLKLGGRCAVIVPDGVLFGSSRAHTAIREQLIDNNQLEAVISLPAGVFKPYAGVSTGILVFTKGGRTDHVWFYDVENDGYSLDDKRNPISGDDLPDLLQRWKKRDAKKDTDRTAKAFFVPAQEIRDNGYDLALNRYKQVLYTEATYDAPKIILKRLKKLNAEIDSELAELEEMLG